MRFHIYHLIPHFTVHGRQPLDKERTCHLCLQYPDSVPPEKLYTGKELVMMEASIDDFHASFYILEIQKILFHLPHVQILGTNHCGNTRRGAFKRCRAHQYVLCWSDHDEKVVASFEHQIQSEYYGGNRSVYIQGIVLENFIAPTQT